MAYWEIPGWGANVRTGRELTGTELLKSLRLAKGTLQPWELPEYGPTVQRARVEGERTLSALPRQFAASGVRGPSAALTLENVGQAAPNTGLNLVNQLRTGGVQQGLGLGQQAEQTGQAAEAAKLAQYQAENQVRLAGLQLREQAKQRRTSAFGSCCFMFIMGEGEVIDQVEKYKHEHFGYESYVANGYRWMSLKLMPVITKSQRVKDFIRVLITQPLSRFAVHNSQNDLKLWLYTPVGIFWCFTWEMIGRMVAYNSKSYQYMVSELE